MTARKLSTITSSETIGQVLKKGRRVNGALLSLYYRAGQAQTHRGPEEQRALAQEGRVAFIAGKRLGTAVLRNRSKRVLRAAFDAAGGTRAGYDVLLVANSRTARSSSREVAQELSVLLSKAHI